MTPVIVAKRRVDGKLIYLSDPNDSSEETERKFIPLRLTRTHPEYEWAEIQNVSDARRERFELPPQSDEVESKKGKSPMKSLKTIASLIVFATFAFLFTVPARAQSYNLGGFFGTDPLASTINIATATTNTTMYLTNGASSINGGPVFTKATAYGAFQPTFRLTGAGTSACVFTFDTSVGGTYWNPAAFTISVTANGTNWVAGVSNQTLGSIGFVRLAGVTNPNGTAITNLVVITAGKSP